MPSSIKAAQLADQIRDYLALWFVKDVPDLFITVNQVTLTPNMIRATVWLSVANHHHKKIDLKQFTQLQNKYQHQLTKTFQRRRIPRIYFKFENQDFEPTQVD